MTDMTVSETLNKAADYLQSSGWIQGSFGEDGGARCLVGALISVEGNLSICPNAEVEMERHLSQRDDFDGSVPGWNDAPERTADDVIAALRAASVIAESREPVTEAATR